MVGEGVADLRPAVVHAFGEAMLVCAQAVGACRIACMAWRLPSASLTVRAGEIVGIAGVAGNGQSELFAAISGEGGRLTAGTIDIAGQDVTPRRHQRAAAGWRGLRAGSTAGAGDAAAGPLER